MPICWCSGRLGRPRPVPSRAACQSMLRSHWVGDGVVGRGRDRGEGRANRPRELEPYHTGDVIES